MDEPTSALLTDLYQLNMMQAYLDHGDSGTAVFEFFMRKLPARRGFLMAAGLEQALDYLENVRFSSAEIDWLAQTGRFGKDLLDQLARFRFTGDVHAMAERNRFLRRRADPAGDRAAPPGATGRDAPYQHSALSVAGRLQSRAHAADSRRQGAGRFRLAPRARRRSRP